MVIRKEQIDILGAAAARQLPLNIETFIRVRWPEITAGTRKGVLRERIMAGIAVARLSGFATDHSICAFVSLMFGIRPRFYQLPRIAEILNDTSINPDERLYTLLFDTTDDDWPSIDLEVNALEWGMLTGAQDGKA